MTFTCMAYLITLICKIVVSMLDPWAKAVESQGRPRGYPAKFPNDLLFTFYVYTYLIDVTGLPRPLPQKWALG